MPRYDSTRLILESHSWWGRLTCTRQFCPGGELCKWSLCKNNIKNNLILPKARGRKQFPAQTGPAVQPRDRSPSFPALPGHMFSLCEPCPVPRAAAGGEERLAHISAAVSSTPSLEHTLLLCSQQPAPSGVPWASLLKTASTPEQELLSPLPLIIVTPSIIANTFLV